MKRVCFLASFTSPLNDKLSQTNMLAPATTPAGNVLPWEFRNPSTQQ